MTARPSPVLLESRNDSDTAQPGIAHILTGLASWFCLPGRSACTHGFPASGAYAAASRLLRAAVGPQWRGATVRVTAGNTDVLVRLIDECGCPDGRVLDLYGSVFGQLAALSAGIVTVRVEW